MRLSADREGRLPHKTKHLNSPLYNNYRVSNPSPPALASQGRQELGAQEKEWASVAARTGSPLQRGWPESQTVKVRQGLGGGYSKPIS